MTSIFINLLNMSICAGFIVLVVIILRLILRKAPKYIVCVLWSLVAFRLIFPISFESSLSILPSTQVISPDIIYSQAPSLQSGIPLINQAINPIISSALAPSAAESVNPVQVIIAVATIVWLIGIAAMLLYALVSYYKIYSRVKISVETEKNVYICDDIKTPFIFGIIKPKIYLPSSLTEKEKICVLAHEKAHKKRLDFIKKPLGFILLTIYWFNPLVWLAYCLFCRDIEFACDEYVIRDMKTKSKKEYTTTLLNCSAEQKVFVAAPLAFGEIGIKKRIKAILNYKKPKLWIIAGAVILCITAAVCLLTNPPLNISSTEETVTYSYKKSQDVFQPNFTLTPSDNSFRFCYSGISSYLPMGKYKIEDNKLILTADDSLSSVYVFDIVDDTFVFNENNSAAIPSYNLSANSNETYCPVPDKAVFTLVEDG